MAVGLLTQCCDIFSKLSLLSISTHNSVKESSYPVGIHLLNRNTRTRCEICSKLTIRTPERRPCSSVSIINFDHVIADWVVYFLVINLKVIREGYNFSSLLIKID